MTSNLEPEECTFLTQAGVSEWEEQGAMSTEGTSLNLGVPSVKYTQHTIWCSVDAVLP